MILFSFISERASKGNIIRENEYKCKCNICGYVFNKKESDIDRMRGCACCSNKKVVAGINDIPSTTPWMVPFFQGGLDEAKKYTRNSNKYIFPKCPDCGKIKEKKVKINNIYNKRSIGCMCSYKGTSYPERVMLRLLEQTELSYEWQFKPEWLYGKRFDFCIEQYKLIIETDGRLGHGFYEWGKKTDDIFIDSLQVDRWKDDRAKEHGYKVIRIDCSISTLEYIRNSIINSDLKNYINFQDIDFCKCEKQALKNLVKEVCEFWEEHQNMSCREIAERFNLGTYTVTQYLVKGEKVGWCSYTVDKGKNLGVSKLQEYHKQNRRPSIYDSIIVTGVDMLGNEITGTITECCEKIGVKRPSRIKEVCDHKKHYNTAFGFKWEYT